MECLCGPGVFDIIFGVFDQLVELARIIRGVKESEYPAEHDLAVQEALLNASAVSLL